jgi:hypothetical protein
VPQSLDFSDIINQSEDLVFILFEICLR